MRRTGALQAFFQSVQKRGGNVENCQYPIEHFLKKLEQGIDMGIE